MGLDKKQKLIIGVGALAILIVVIIVSIMACNEMKQKPNNENPTESSKLVDKNDDKEKETTKKDDKDETSKDETSKDDKDETSKDETSKDDDVTSESDKKDEEETTVKGEESTEGNQGGATSTVIKTEFGVVNPAGSLTTVTNRVSSHDPSIEYDPSTNKWYIFGSHTAFASTSDLRNWTHFEYENTTSQAKYGQIFAVPGTWAKRGNSNYDIKGNLWAPDVIYNHDMGKWCMYMSVNGDNFYSSIAMATADKITGPYTYVGTVVYSGFNASNVSVTDYKKATGSTDTSRYSWGYYGTNAIDPCVLYDKDGELWMVYGSWFGGLFMLKLDNETGLRDYDYTYTLDQNASDGRASDPYMGVRVSGGYGGTGEGPYIVWDEKAGYYYMYVSYCGLESTTDFGGYHMRLFRSKNIDGPYTDAAGHYAVRERDGVSQVDKGIKIMGNYAFSSLKGVESSTGSANGYMSPGHNSAMVDDAGNRYLIYHTRFNNGSGWHQVRVHQQFLNEDGWLVTAPYEYLGSKLSATGYSNTDIVGTYEYINHGNDATTGLIGMLPTQEVTLNADGTITGDVTGTWSQKAGTPYATMVIGGVTYKGVFFKQYDESTSHKETMTFTLIGSNNLAIWGSKAAAEVAETGSMIGSYTFEDTASLGKDNVGTVGVATINGCTTFNDGTRGKVLSFDGNDDYVVLPSAATKNLKGYTVMMWVKATEILEWARVFDFGDSTDKNMFFTLKAYGSGLRFAQKANGGDEKQITGANAIEANKWTHIAVTISASTKKAILYVNGTRIGSVILDAHPNTFAGSQNYLGKSQYPDPYFKGYMDNVFIFNYALSANEITTYMNK